MGDGLKRAFAAAKATQTKPAKFGCRRCGGWGYIRHMVPAACPTCDLCNGTGADPDQGPATLNGHHNTPGEQT